MDASRLLPYLVPASYVEGQDVSPDGLVRHVGHDVFMMLVHDLDGVCRNVVPDELDRTPQEAYAQAIANLEALVRSKEISLSAIHGPRELPVLIGGGHWAAASCLLLPRLFEVASRNLSSAELLAAVPSRDSLLVFRRVDDDYNLEMSRFIENAERGERKRVSNSLFSLTTRGVEPFGTVKPPPGAGFFSRLFR